MNLEWHKQQYKEKMAAIEAKYKKMAEIWHAKGRKAFSKAIYKQEIPNWNDFFEEEWLKFKTIKVGCPQCGTIKIIELDFDQTLDINEFFNRYINLICTTCKDFIDINRWEVIK